MNRSTQQEFNQELFRHAWKRVIRASSVTLFHIEMRRINRTISLSFIQSLPVPSIAKTKLNLADATTKLIT